MKNNILNLSKLSLLTIYLFSILSCGSSEDTTPKVKIFLDPNGGEITDKIIEVKENNTYDLPNPTRDNRKFLGWYTSLDENGNKIYSDYIYDQDISLYARWDSYDLSYLDDKGEIFKKVTVKDGDISFEESSYPVNSDKSKCFKKWDFNYLTKIYKDYDISPIYSDHFTVQLDAEAEASFTEEDINYHSYYEDDFFSTGSNTFNTDLALFSYVATTISYQLDLLDEYFGACGFNNSHGYNYDIKPTKDTIGVYITSKVVDTSIIIPVIFRSYHYEAEWGNNFSLGLEGNHNGFMEASSKAYSYITSYINDNNIDISKVKLLLSGYSRGGGLSSLTSKLLLDDNYISKDNLYTYSFESIPSVTSNDENKYSNIFNVINKADPIPNVPPQEYGFVRPGVEIDIYDANVDLYLSKFNKDCVLSPFTPVEDSFNTELEIFPYLLNKILSYENEDEPSKEMKTREQYVNNYQEHVVYILERLLTIDLKDLSEIIKNLSTLEMISLLTADGLHTFISNLLDEHNIEYDSDYLLECCNVFISLLTGPGSSLLTLYLTNPDDLTRTISFHYPEVNFALLKYYSYK